VTGNELVVAVVVVIFAATGVRVVRPFQKGVIERLGKYMRTAQSGITLIIPMLDSMRKVDMREQVVDVPPQEVITRDNVVVTVDAVVYYEATDPVKLIYNVADFYTAATKLAQTNLRNVIGEMTLDDTLTSRETINTELRTILDEATDKWGTRVVRVEIQRIDPPTDVTQAMHRQMKAERERRAMILEAEGEKQSAIERATGDRQAQILKAEGEASKIYLPLETSGVLGAIGGIGDLFRTDGGDDAEEVAEKAATEDKGDDTPPGPRRMATTSPQISGGPPASRGQVSMTHRPADAGG